MSEFDLTSTSSPLLKSNAFIVSPWLYIPDGAYAELLLVLLLLLLLLLTFLLLDIAVLLLLSLLAVWRGSGVERFFLSDVYFAWR